MAVHERLGEDEPGTLRQVEGLADLGRPAREGFLAEHVVAGLERAQRPLTCSVFGNEM
jgi:hypothetical protein